jgi:hypothetical protein
MLDSIWKIIKFPIILSDLLIILLIGTLNLTVWDGNEPGACKKTTSSADNLHMGFLPKRMEIISTTFSFSL